GRGLEQGAGRGRPVGCGLDGQLFFAGEMVEEAPLAQARGLADVVHPRGAVAPGTDHPEGGLEQPCARVMGIGGIRFGRGRSGHAMTIPTGWYGDNGNFRPRLLPSGWPANVSDEETLGGRRMPKALGALLAMGGAGSLVATLLAATGRPPARPIEVDHLMLLVSPGAPERASLERAGFTVAPTRQEHEGQGTASVMVELENGFLELCWRDTSVRVAPGLEPVARRFERMSRWRETGWSPIGLGLRRAQGAPDSLPFPARPVHAAWMAPGEAIELVSPVDDTLGPRI